MASAVAEVAGWVLAMGLAIGFASVVVTTLRRSREAGDAQRRGGPGRDAHPGDDSHRGGPARPRAGRGRQVRSDG